LLRAPISRAAEILEYCKVSELLTKEKDFIKLLKPEYNISLDPTASFAGRKHSDKSRQQMSDAHKSHKGTGGE
jgi:hypothetical protein